MQYYLLTDISKTEFNKVLFQLLNYKVETLVANVSYKEYRIMIFLSLKLVAAETHYYIIKRKAGVTVKLS